MSSVIALDHLLDSRRLWRGKSRESVVPAQSTGHEALNRALPGGGWPDAALSELLIAAPGIGELRLLWPTLASLTAKGERVVLVDPPYVPFPHAWLMASINLRHLSIIKATGKQALWAAEQCLRSGCCGAVLCWPHKADDRALRRLQVAAETGRTLAFAYRPLSEAVNSSPAALRIAVEGAPAQLRILKCRGGIAPAQPIPADAWH